jgi:hypothetical protein
VKEGELSASWNGNIEACGLLFQPLIPALLLKGGNSRRDWLGATFRKTIGLPEGIRFSGVPFIDAAIQII